MHANNYLHTHTHTHTHTLPLAFIGISLNKPLSCRLFPESVSQIFRNSEENQLQRRCSTSLAILSMLLCIYFFPVRLPSFRNSEKIDRFQKFGGKLVSEYRVPIDLMSSYVYTRFQR